MKLGSHSHARNCVRFSRIAAGDSIILQHNGSSFLGGLELSRFSMGASGAIGSDDLLGVALVIRGGHLGISHTGGIPVGLTLMIILAERKGFCEIVSLPLSYYGASPKAVEGGYEKLRAGKTAADRVGGLVAAVPPLRVR